MYGLMHAISYIINTDKQNINIEKNRETITKLKFIGTFQNGEKIDVKNLKIEQNNFFTPIKRMLYGDGRNNTIIFLTSTIERSFEIVQSFCNSDRKSEQIFCSNIIFDLIKATHGLKNIQKTYKEDKMFACNIDILIECIQAKITELKEKYPHLFQFENDLLLKIEKDEEKKEEKTFLI
jgi:hypothetical protein